MVRSPIRARTVVSGRYWVEEDCGAAGAWRTPDETPAVVRREARYGRRKRMEGIARTSARRLRGATPGGQDQYRIRVSCPEGLTAQKHFGQPPRGGCPSGIAKRIDRLRRLAVDRLDRAPGALLDRGRRG